MKYTHLELMEKLKALGLVSADDKPVSYSRFKNSATIMRYAKKNKIVFVGRPKENLFGFYMTYNIDSDNMRFAYDMFVKLVKGNMEDYEDGCLQWGNAGIPLVYKNLRIS